MAYYPSGVIPLPKRSAAIKLSNAINLANGESHDRHDLPCYDMGYYHPQSSQIRSRPTQRRQNLARPTYRKPRLPLRSS